MYELLSYPLEDRSPVHPSLEDVSITMSTTVGNDGYETHTIRTSNHAGTHIDAPAHFIEAEGGSLNTASMILSSTRSPSLRWMQVHVSP